MSLQYEPSPGALPDEHWGTVFLSQRDASGNIPINFVTHPGVHLTSACFANGIYDDIPTQTCISNLIAAQFRRLVIDLYWDTINRQFSLCPVELPPLSGNSSSGVSVDASALSSLLSDRQSAAVEDAPQTSPVTTQFPRRQDTTSDTIVTATPTTSTNSTSNNATTSSTTSRTVPMATSTGVQGSTLLELGPYKCSLDLNLGSLISLYEAYIADTSNTVSARFHYLDINLRAAASYTAPQDPAPPPSRGQLPEPHELIGAQFLDVLPKFVYTPPQLAEERENLERSWYRGSRENKDAGSSYFNTTRDSDGHESTVNGWPSEIFLLIVDSRRLLLSWNEIDTQMQGYNFTADAENVFDAGSTERSIDIQTNAAGVVTSGCIYRPDENTVAEVNSSWALTTLADGSPASDTVANLTACGISSMLNSTLGAGSSAQTNMRPYSAFVQSAVFGWATDEPRNASGPSPAGSDDPLWRCAVLDSTPASLGHWRVDHCANRRRAACRVAEHPYAWRLSRSDVSFDGAAGACPADTHFSLPRTGLENTYLYDLVRTSATAHSADPSVDQALLDGVWINFNSLDQAGCWVANGPNGTCPYSDRQEEMHQRQVLIPALAALIVLILTALTMVVKCGKNRKVSRKERRRRVGGWDYEGIPS